MGFKKYFTGTKLLRLGVECNLFVSMGSNIQEINFSQYLKIVKIAKMRSLQTLSCLQLFTFWQSTTDMASLQTHLKTLRIFQQSFELKVLQYLLYLLPKTKYKHFNLQALTERNLPHKHPA